MIIMDKRREDMDGGFQWDLDGRSLEFPDVRDRPTVARRYNRGFDASSLMYVSPPSFLGRDPFFDDPFQRGSAPLELLGRLLPLLALQAQILSRKPTYYWNEKTLQEIAALSKTLREEHPNTHFFGIGNSPSYVIYGIDYLSRTQGDAAVETGYIPYSARYLKSVDPRTVAGSLYDFNESSFVYDQVQANQEKYKRYLETLGFHPNKIVDSFLLSSQKTAVVDNMQSGGSFASFIHFMYMWAKELHISEAAFSDAFKCIALTDRCAPLTITLPGLKNSVTLEVVSISSDLRFALNGNMSAETDRFVPHYDAEKWAELPVEVADDNKDNAVKVKQMIEEAIDGRLHNILALGQPSATAEDNFSNMVGRDFDRSKKFPTMRGIPNNNDRDDEYYASAQKALAEGRLQDASLALIVIRNPKRIEGFSALREAIKVARKEAVPNVNLTPQSIQPTPSQVSLFVPNPALQPLRPISFSSRFDVATSDNFRALFRRLAGKALKSPCACADKPTEACRNTL